MGRELQKRKNRTKIPKIKKKRKLLRNGDKKINVLGNALIAENWDNSQTLVQNYRRLGLTSRLNAPTGGVERSKLLDDSNAGDIASDSLHINGSAASLAKRIDPTEVRVERDPETGKILRVVRDDEMEVAGRKHKRSNPLGDPLNEIEMDDEDDGAHHGHEQLRRNGSEFVHQLEKQAAQEEGAVKKRRPRQQSKREEEWIERLIEKHGDNIEAMFRDKKLNPMQQSEGDLRRRIKTWKERQKQ